MASSDVARFLRKQYISSLVKEENSHSSSDPILARFKTISKKLNDNSTALTNPESISWLYDLHDALTEWRILKDHKSKSIKRIFFFKDHVANKRSVIEAKLNELERSPGLQASSSSSTESGQPDSELLLDRYTFYKPDRITYIEDEVTDKLEKVMIDWLLKSGADFKAVGIYGAGGSGKTALVKNVLTQKTVVGDDNFKCIIWACLSELTCEEEIDDWIIEYILYRLGLDTDSLPGNVHKNKDWLMEEVERRLKNSGNYILVLDDMWHCSKWFTDDLLGKLKQIDRGAVIVTSRRKTVAEKIGDKNKRIHLDPLAYKGSAFFQTKDLGN